MACMDVGSGGRLGTYSGLGYHSSGLCPAFPRIAWEVGPGPCYASVEWSPGADEEKPVVAEVRRQYYNHAGGSAGSGVVPTFDPSKCHNCNSPAYFRALPTCLLVSGSSE